MDAAPDTPPKGNVKVTRDDLLEAFLEVARGLLHQQA